ncbi:MAG TPA: tetratricopeptide repeat protein [Terriglobia bacterium]|nr:tetratricopeptide repeat protein [Terriglobia bacterium]
MRRYWIAPLAGVLLLVVAATGCDRLKARDQLNKGVNAFRNAQFQEAVAHFQQAASLDPTLEDARLYLAMSYFQQYAPGGASPDNLKMGQQAIQSFNNVLELDPKNTTALATIGTIYYDMKDFDKAKEYQRRRLDIQPNNPEPYYWVGVMDYALAAKNDNDMRKTDPKLAQIGPSGDLPPLPEKLRSQLEEQNSKLIDEAMDALNKAINLKPNYDEAMAYLNLIYRQKADIENDSSTRQADIKQANDWLAKAMEARKTTGASAAGATAAH